MRILLISSADPGDYSFGGAQRDNNLRDALMQVADVDTILWRGEDPPSVPSDWNEQRVIKIGISPNAGRWERLKTLASLRQLIDNADRKSEYAVIIARHYPKAAAVPFRLHRKLIIDADDFRVTTAAQPFSKRALYFGRRAFFRWIGKRSLHTWVVDPRDCGLLALPPRKMSILRNTARHSGEPAAEQSSNIQRPRLLMVGLYAYLPNADGLMWFAKTVLPKVLTRYPRAELHAVGGYFQKELEALGSQVKMRGFVSDLAREYKNADLVVCPIQSGSGTQIKVIEALMHSKPTVVSDFSFQGFSDVLKPDEHLLVASKPAEWAEKIGLVLENPSRFRAVGIAGQHAATAAYSVSGFHKHVLSTLRKLV